MSDLVLQVAAKAVVYDEEGKVLILKESAVHDTNTQVGLYQLPGGRLEPGESYLEALQREVMEETGLKVQPGKPLYVGEWRPVLRGVPHQIVAIFTACKAETTEVKLSDEHDGFEWIDPRNRGHYEFADPDGEVIDTFAAALNS